MPERPLLESSDACPKCGCTVYLRFPSMNLKRCADCYHEWPWRLKEGQKPLVKHQR